MPPVAPLPNRHEVSRRGHNDGPSQDSGGDPPNGFGSAGATDEDDAARRATSWASRASSRAARPHSMPSTVARARCVGVDVLRRRPWIAPVANGRFGVRSPSRYGTTTRPSAPAGARSASEESSCWSTPSSRAIASSTRAALSVHTRREEAAGRVGKACDYPRRVGHRVVANSEYRARGPDRHDDVSGRRQNASAAAALSPVPHPIPGPLACARHALRG